MNKLVVPVRILVILSLVVVGLISAAGVVSADAPEKTTGFVCPVLGGKAGLNGNSPKLTYIPSAGGPFYTVIGPEVTVPVHATNGNGAGSPGGWHASPGDTDYSAIWP